MLRAIKGAIIIALLRLFSLSDSIFSVYSVYIIPLMNGILSYSRCVFRYFFPPSANGFPPSFLFIRMCVCACICRSFLFAVYYAYLCWLVFCYFPFFSFSLFFSLPLITEICRVHRSQWRYPCYGSGKLYTQAHLLHSIPPFQRMKTASMY